MVFRAMFHVNNRLTDRLNTILALCQCRTTGKEDLWKFEYVFFLILELIFMVRNYSLRKEADIFMCSMQVFVVRPV